MESSWRRAWKDTEYFRHTAGSFWGLEIVGAAIMGLGGGFVGFLQLPIDATSTQTFLYPAIGGAVGVIIGLAIAFLGIYTRNLFRAPYRQRDEIQRLAEQQRKPSGIEVNDAVRLLQTESLVVKHNNGEERAYSFTEVFLSIADYLSVGISLNNFEGQIKKGLHIADDSGWYFPYEDEGITHLIGTLVQNALVERHNEEYQHMQREVVSGMVGIYLTPDAHLVKDTEVKYYLSPLGSRIIERLRQQSTSHSRFEITWLSEKFLLKDASGGYHPYHNTDEKDKTCLVVMATIRVDTLRLISVQSIAVEVGGQLIPWGTGDVNIYGESETDEYEFTFPLTTPRGKQLAKLIATVDGEKYTSPKSFIIDFPRKVFK